MVTLEQLQKIFTQTSKSILNKFVDPLNSTIEKYDLDTLQRTAAFLAQVGHESAGFNFTEENLNYSVNGLRKIFSKYFPNDEIAVEYARKPQKIASRVYANRMGNGNEASGDGWKYRGRGLIQLTGKDNYERVAKILNKTVDETIAHLSTVEGATESAGIYWKDRNLNRFVDADDFLGLTKAINGGTHGLQERVNLYNMALDALSI